MSRFTNAESICVKTAKGNDIKTVNFSDKPSITRSINGKTICSQQHPGGTPCTKTHHWRQMFSMANADDIKNRHELEPSMMKPS